MFIYKLEKKILWRLVEDVNEKNKKADQDLDIYHSECVWSLIRGNQNYIFKAQ